MSSSTIKFKGICSEDGIYEISVVNNNKANILYFLIRKQQASINLTGYKAFLKATNHDDFIDKQEIEIVPSNEEETDIRLKWVMKRKHTQFKRLSLQIQFENLDEDVIWQTEIFDIILSDTIDADQEISDLYPCILLQLQQKVEQILSGQYFPKEYKQLDEWLYYSEFDEQDDVYAKQYFDQHEITSIPSCSSFRKENIYGRNLDWTYDNLVSFVVKSSSSINRYQSLGVVSAFPAFTKEFVESHEKSDLYKLLPFAIVDGINEHKLLMNVNVIHTNEHIFDKTIPLIEKRESVSSAMLVKYCLDHFKTVNEAFNYLRDYVEIYQAKFIKQMGYASHYMIADSDGTYVIEFYDNSIILIENNKLTNFYLANVEFNDDGTLYSPLTSPIHKATIENNLQPYSMGVERYNLIVNNEESLSVEQIMSMLKYTNSYKNSTNPFWYTEFVGNYPTLETNLTVDSEIDDFDEVVSIAKNNFEHRIRDGKTWQTVHTSIYDIEEKSLKLQVQENNEIFEIPFTMEDSEAKWGKIKGNIEEQLDLKEKLDDLNTKITNETSRAQTSETNLGTQITSETSRATQAETTLQTNITNVDNKLNEKVSIEQITNRFTYNGDTVTFNQKFKNLKTGNEETKTENIGLANSTTAGLMSPATVQGIQQLTTDVAILKGQNVRLSYTTKSDPTAEEIRQFVIDSGYTDTTKWVNIGVIVKATNHKWEYYTNTQLWTDVGLDTVNQFTNTQSGVIKGSENDGQVYAEDNGTGSVVGWSTLKNRVTNIESELEDVIKYDVISEMIPHKGDIIKIENNRYRVLEENDGIVKLYALFDIGNSRFNNSRSDTNIYEGSVLDTFINNWFNNQSETFKNACVNSRIVQITYQLSYSEPDYWDFKYDHDWNSSKPRFIDESGGTSSFTRKAYAPCIEDYFEYHESNETTSNDLMKFFFEGNGEKGSYSNKSLWLRGANTSSSNYAWIITSRIGAFESSYVDNTHAVRPLIKIDLSKIDWEVLE